MKDYEPPKIQELLDAMLADNAVKFGYTPDKLDHRLPELVKYLYFEDHGTKNAQGTHNSLALTKKEGGDILANEAALFGKCASGTSVSTPIIQIENSEFFDLRRKLDIVKTGKKKADSLIQHRG